MAKLFHTGFRIVEKPDITVGRKNADFGQGFYLSDDKEFSLRWAKERKGLTAYLNTYELNVNGLAVKRFSRDEEWFEYIGNNRSGKPDAYADTDVIIGPIANDTLYETWGIITSGLLISEQALRLLMIGPIFEQTVIKSEKAAAALQFVNSREVSGGEIAAYRRIVRKEEIEYQNEFVKLLGDMGVFTDQ